MFNKIKQFSRKIRLELKVYKLVIRNKKTAILAKIILSFGVTDALIPIDFIPDFIPVLGQLDDLVILPLIFYFGIKLIPKDIIEMSRKEVYFIK